MVMENLTVKPSALGGEIIKEKNPIQGLCDGDIYVVCSYGDSFYDAMAMSLRNLIPVMRRNANLLHQYNLRAIPDFGQYASEGNLFDAVTNCANVIIPLTTPNELGKQYLVSYIRESEIDLYLPSMLLRAEDISKKAIEEALMNLAVNDATTCKNILFDINFDGSGVFRGMVGMVLGALDTPIMGMAPMSGSDIGANIIDYQKSRDIFSRFVDNCATLRKAQKKTKFSPKFQDEFNKAKFEIDYVFNTIWGASKNMDSLRMIIVSQSDKKLVESYDNFLNKESMAKRSKIQITIEESTDGIDRKNKNDGLYRIYASNGKTKTLIHFKRKPTYIVYMMYLMDKSLRGESVDLLSIQKNKKVFCDIYSKVYLDGQGESLFNGLVSRIVKGEIRQTRLKDCYTDIQKNLKEVVNSLGEEVPPFVIPTQSSHLTILDEKISIPSVFKNIEFIY